jgi:hypothetical protein
VPTFLSHLEEDRALRLPEERRKHKQKSAHQGAAPTARRDLDPKGLIAAAILTEAANMAVAAAGSSDFLQLPLAAPS